MWKRFVCRWLNHKLYTINLICASVINGEELRKAGCSRCGGTFAVLEMPGLWQEVRPWDEEAEQKLLMKP
jgi:hypothetical protein